MANKERPQRGFVGRILRPWSNPTIIPRGSSGLSLKEEWSALRQNLSDDQLHCPNDGQPLKLIDVFDTDADGNVSPTAKAHRALGCDCGYHLPIEPIIAQARTEIGNIRSAEKQFMTFGILLVVVFGGISYLNGSLVTLLGGLVLGLALIVRSLFFRYRRWQVEHDRLFESTPPIFDWLRHEWHQ